MSKPLKWIVGVFVLAILMLCFLSYGNPQSGKWVYMWQAYVYPKHNHEEVWLNQNNDYTGEWRYWSERGTLLGKYDLKNGVVVNSKLYFENGVLKSSMDLKKDFVQEGLTKLFYEDGKLNNCASFYDGQLNGFETYFHKNGQLKSATMSNPEIKFHIQKICDEQGNITEMYYWVGNGFESEQQAICIFHSSKSIDLRSQYTKQLSLFESELKKWLISSKISG